MKKIGKFLQKKKNGKEILKFLFSTIQEFEPRIFLRTLKRGKNRVTIKTEKGMKYRT
jgi:hypothetical protein